jgi:MYXO-CTERM domain-containing protein
MLRRLSVLALALPAVLIARDAAAVRTPDYLAERPLEVAAGEPARLVRMTQTRPTAAGAAAWKAFTTAHGSWQGLWDASTGVPARIWGEGIAAPGANTDPAAAEAAAWRILDAQLGLLAPGTKRAHWQLAADVVHGKTGDLRTVSFTQSIDGAPVVGGAISVLFKRDRAIVLATAALPARLVADDVARAEATAWIARLYGATPTVRGLGGAVVLPIVRDGMAAVDYRVARVVTVDLVSPRARWDVYVDAATGAPIARRQLLSFSGGTLTYETALRHPGAARQAFPAVRASVTANGSPVVTDDAGGFTVAGTGPTSVLATVTGPRARVSDDGAPGATTTLAVPADGTGAWAAATDERLDAQLTGFIHANRMKSFAATALNPGLAWLNTQMIVTVNEGGDCNAYSDGTDINFLQAGSGCENTGRLPDVVYHEFGHALHHQSIIPGAGDFDTAMSEGVSDYLAATTVDDAGMGRGFFRGTDAALRDLDPDGGEYYWPLHISPDPHETGLIIAGALWDLRTAMIARYGATLGKERADDLYYATLRRADDIPTTYPEVLAADDDDGNLANGTPNRCLIDAAFGPHGLVDGTNTFGVGLPVRDGAAVSLAVTAVGGCAAPELGNVALVWRRAGGADAGIPMVRTGDTWTANIPTQPDGTAVEYRVIATMASGAMLRFPDNPGDPYYRYYVGPLTPIYCTDFESDPFAAGWTHSASSAVDDWQWSTANGTTANGDPVTAASGDRLVGTDLRSDGLYPRNATETLLSPPIDTRGYTGVRLQFKRWLTVEDGFYDKATIEADGAEVWRNFATNNPDANTHSLDRAWKAEDLDVAAAAADGTLRIGFKLQSDEGLQFGGWNVDDFCVLAAGVAPAPVCGNGTAETGESCDDGNTAAGDGCSELCELEVAVDDPSGGCCSTGSDPRGAALLGLASAALLVRRRRRSA